MPNLTDALLPDGALVTVEIGYSAVDARQLRMALRPVPPGVAVQALIDSGADMSAVDSTALAGWGLPVQVFVQANVPGAGLRYFRQREVSLTILHPSGLNLRLGNLTVVEMPLGAMAFQALIGRDVLALCRFLYDGPAGQFELGY